MFVVLVNLPVCAPVPLRLLSGPPFSSEAALQEEQRLLVAAGVLCAVGYARARGVWTQDRDARMVGGASVIQVLEQARPTYRQPQGPSTPSHTDRFSGLLRG